MIIGGISLAATPLMTFIGAGYLIIILFFIAGMIGMTRAFHEKRYGKEFIFAILSLILGIAGLTTPGAAAINSSTLLYMAAVWLIIHGILSILSAVKSKGQRDTLAMAINGILGVLELGLGAYSFAHPTVLAINLGILIGLYYIEHGVSTILIGSALCIGGNNLTLIFTVVGVLTIIGGLSMIASPLGAFVGIGYYIVLLFLMNGVLGVVRAANKHCYDRKFIFAIISLILGVAGFTVPGIVAQNSYIILYMAAAWLFIHGVLTIITAVNSRNKGAGTFSVIIGTVLGVLELIMCVVSVIYPVMLAFNLGILVGLYFIESGANMIFVGADVSKAVAITRAVKSAEGGSGEQDESGVN